MNPRPSIPGTLKSLRQQAVALFEEQNAIAILANHPARLTYDDQQEQLSAIVSMQNAKEIKSLIKALRQQIEEMRQRFGVNLNTEQLISLISFLEDPNPQYACYVPVWQLSEWLSFYDSMGFPPHCRISIDVRGIGKDYPGGFETRLLEATLFEDMASLFNNARKGHLDESTEVALKATRKLNVAMYRATASAAFYFVECFMNGLAADYAWTHRGQITQADLALLTEEPRHVSTRDKLVKYPRIITGSQFPPLDETNCQEMKFIVNKSKSLRDAIVHASSAKNTSDPDFDKEIAIFLLDYEKVEEIVDAAVTLVRKVQAVTRKTELAWLFDRTQGGFYPVEAFD